MAGDRSPGVRRGAAGEAFAAASPSSAASRAAAREARRHGLPPPQPWFDAAADAILLVDPRGMVAYANARAVAMFGDRVAHSGCACLSLVAIDGAVSLTGAAAAWRELAARARSQAIRVLATAHVEGEGPMPAELTLWPVVAPGAAGTAVVVRDRSDAVRTERHLQEVERHLHQSQKLEAIGRLAGGIAHDFNNLLTIISGYSELLAASPSADPEVHEGLEQVREAAMRAAQLTGQLLAFSRQSAMEPAQVDLNRLVRRESDMLRRIVDEDIELATALAPGLPEVRGDAGRFAQVVMNLVLNARDAMPAGGRLVVRTSLATVGADDPGHPAVTAPGPYVLLTVEDTGFGMTPEECERVFEPFYTTKGEGAGTGLGMTTVQAIVAECKGFISIASRVGNGTTVRVYLPVAAQRTVAAASGDARTAPGGRETVLLVEDNAAVRRLVEAILTDHGYTVLSASDGDDAIHQLDRSPAAVQLVVSDVVMPHRNGRAVVAYAQRLNPRIKALYLSGYTEDAIVRQGILRDDVAFLQKPFTPAALLRAVREALDT